jgi:hypothetical protein
MQTQDFIDVVKDFLRPLFPQSDSSSSAQSSDSDSSDESSGSNDGSGTDDGGGSDDGSSGSDDTGGGGIEDLPPPSGEDEEGPV